MENIRNAELAKSICILDTTVDVDCKYTIAIPTFKRADTLKFALESAINQRNAPSYCILVVDNNPERGDETEILVKSLKCKNLKYYKNENNLGMTGNWNKLYLLSLTEWVVMLHDDDMLAENYLNCMDKFLNNGLSSFDVISPPFQVCNKREIIQNNRCIYKYKNISINDFIIGNPIGAPLGLVVKKSFIEDVGGFRDNYYPSLDYDFYVSAAINGRICKVKGEPLALYVVGNNESLKDDTIVNFVRNKNSIILDECYNKLNIIAKILFRFTRNTKDLCILNWFNPTIQSLEMRYRLYYDGKRKPHKLDKLRIFIFLRLSKLVSNFNWTKLKIYNES